MKKSSQEEFRHLSKQKKQMRDKNHWLFQRKRHNQPKKKKENQSLLRSQKENSDIHTEDLFFLRICSRSEEVLIRLDHIHTLNQPALNPRKRYHNQRVMKMKKHFSIGRVSTRVNALYYLTPL